LAWQDKNAEAEAEYRAIWETRRQTLGDDHPDTLTAKESLDKLINDEPE
jgi:hypothetical protein